jgi:hypothetical protein
LGSDSDPEIFSDYKGLVSDYYINDIREIALTCWNNYLFSGYGEIHFKIDCFHKPWIVGITINPSLSPNSPFVRSAINRGYTYEGIIIRIIDESIFYTKYRNIQKAL